MLALYSRAIRIENTLFQTAPILVPGYLCITWTALEPPHQQTLRVYALTSFARFWRPLSEISFANEVHESNLPPVACEYPEFGKIPIQACDSVKLLAFRSPLHSEAYRIMLHTTDLVPKRKSFVRRKLEVPGRSTRSMLFTYSFTVPGLAARPAWHLISSAPTEHHVRPASISLSRYCLGRRWHFVIDALLKRDDVEQGPGLREVVPYDTACSAIYLTPYSGAVAVLTSYSLTISYYR